MIKVQDTKKSIVKSTTMRPGVEKFFGIDNSSNVSAKPLPKIYPKSQPGYNFEPQDSDLEQLDDYIEDLIENEDKLYVPTGREPALTLTTPSLSSSSSSSTQSQSIDDLLSALESEIHEDKSNVIASSGRVSELLGWMKEMDFGQNSAENTKQSYNELKYKNLEKLLKRSEKSSFISKIPQDNLCFFERKMSGVQDQNFALERSKTDPNLSVSVKNIARKFEPVAIPSKSTSCDNRKAVVKKRKRVKKAVGNSGGRRKSESELGRVQLPVMLNSVQQLRENIEGQSIDKNGHPLSRKVLKKVKDCSLQ